jgi:hypothetical protein
MAKRRSTRSAGHGLPERLAVLEERVTRLERDLSAFAPRRREPAKVAPPRGPRCPGCSLPVEAGARGTCPWCGFVFDTVPAARRRP